METTINVGNNVGGDNVDGELTIFMFQVVVGDHDVTRGDGEQRASVLQLFELFLTDPSPIIGNAFHSLTH